MTTTKRMWQWAILLPVFTFFADTMCVWPWRSPDPNLAGET